MFQLKMSLITLQVMYMNERIYMSSNLKIENVEGSNYFVNSLVSLLSECMQLRSEIIESIFLAWDYQAIHWAIEAKFLLNATQELLEQGMIQVGH